MLSRRFSADVYSSVAIACILHLAIVVTVCGICIPHQAAGQSLLKPAIPPLPGEGGIPADAFEVPGFLKPLVPAETAPGEADKRSRPPATENWIGDSRMWNNPQANRFEAVRVETAAERDFAHFDRWRRGFARLAVVALICTFIGSFAVLFLLAQQR